MLCGALYQKDSTFTTTSTAPGLIEAGTSALISAVNPSRTATAALPAIYALPDTSGTFFVTQPWPAPPAWSGNRSVDPRVARAAASGDVLDLYMIRLGSTRDASAFITDRIFSGAYTVSAAVTAAVGGEAALVLFAGLTSPGLYLVRTQVPVDLALGPQPIRVSVGDSNTRSVLARLVGPPL